MGGVVPRRSVRSWAVQTRVHNQQEAELQGVAWAIRLASRYGWRAVTLFTDSTAAGYQAVGLRAKTWLKRQLAGALGTVLAHGSVKYRRAV